jgi:hypothetical protein
VFLGDAVATRTHEDNGDLRCGHVLGDERPGFDLAVLRELAIVATGFDVARLKLDLQIRCHAQW